MLQIVPVKYFNDPLRLVFLRLCDRIRVDPSVHESAHILHCLCDRRRHGDHGLSLAGPDQVVNKMVQAFSGRLPDDGGDLLRDVLFGQDPGPHRIIHIVVEIGDLVRQADDPALQRGRRPTCLVIQDPVPDLPGQVQPLSVPLQHIHEPQTLDIVGKSKRTHPVQGPLSCVSKGCMSQIMAQRDRFDQIFIQAQGFRNGPRILRYLQRMCHPGPVVISEGSQKNLCLVLQSPKRLAVQDPVPVPLESRTDITGDLVPFSPPALCRQACPGRKDLTFPLFKLLTNRHESLLLCCKACCVSLLFCILYQTSVSFFPGRRKRLIFHKKNQHTFVC